MYLGVLPAVAHEPAGPVWPKHLGAQRTEVMTFGDGFTQFFGTALVSSGTRIVNSHTDSVRVELKPKPFRDSFEISMLEPRVHGGWKNDQRVSRPLALVGKVTRNEEVGSWTTGRTDWRGWAGVAPIRCIVTGAGRHWQVHPYRAGYGGGTITQSFANANIDTIDVGIGILSMHSPTDVSAKAVSGSSLADSRHSGARRHHGLARHRPDNVI